MSAVRTIPPRATDEQLDEVAAVLIDAAARMQREAAASPQPTPTVEAAR